MKNDATHTLGLFACCVVLLLLGCGSDDPTAPKGVAGSGGQAGTGAGPDAGGGSAGTSGGTAGNAGDAAPDGAVAVARVVINESELAVAPGGTVTLTALAFDSSDQPVAAEITWQSADPAIAAVSAGVVTGVVLGQTQVTALAGGVSSSPATVWVNPSGSTGDALRKAVAAGEITADDALVYRILYVFRDSRFPGKYRGTTTDSGIDDLLMFEADRRFDALTVAQQEMITPYFYPPPYRGTTTRSWPGGGTAREASMKRPPCKDGNVPSALWATVDSPKFRIWYRTTSPGHLALANGLSTNAEAAYKELVDTRHFREPLKDDKVQTCNGGDGRLDVYIDSINAKGQTTPQASVPATPAGTSTTFITVDPGSLRGTMAHEIMHSIQHAYPNFDTPNFLWTMDATATWAANEVFFADHEQWPRAGDLMKRMDQPLFYPNQYCETGNTSAECTGDSHSDLRMYAAYLFFEFASGKSRPDYKFVQGFFEQIPLQSDVLSALDVALVAAGEGGLTNTWAKFVLAVWNQRPVEVLDRLIVPTTWQGITNANAPNADLQTIDITMPGASVVKVAPSKPDPANAAERVPISVNELSAVYERYQFAPSVRSVIFFNGFSQKLSTIALKRNAAVGPGGSSVTLDGGLSYVVYDTTAEQRKGRQVWALKRTATALSPAMGEWKLEDWTDRPFVTLCRDKIDERVLELVLIFANGNFTDARRTYFDHNAVGAIGDQKSTIIASPIPCWKYQGKYDAKLVHNDGVDNIEMSSTLTATYSGQPFIQNVSNASGTGQALRALRFTADPATISVTWALRQSCGAVPPTALFEMNTSGAEFFASSAPPSVDSVIATHGSSGEGGYWQGETYTVYHWPNRLGCNGTVKPTPAVNVFNFLLKMDKWQKIDFLNMRLASPPDGAASPAESQGGYPTAGDVTNNWCLAAMREKDDGSVDIPAVCP